MLLPSVRGTRNVFAERTGGGFFLDVAWNRDVNQEDRLLVAALHHLVERFMGQDKTRRAR